MSSNFLGEVVKTADETLTLKHPEHGEEYHSRAGAGLEARELYIKRSGILSRFCNHPDRLVVLDVGLGLAYNAMATIESWQTQTAPPSLRLISLEVDAGLVEALTSLKAPWMAGWPDTWQVGAQSLSKIENNYHASIKHPSGSDVTLEWYVLIGDAAIIPVKEYGETGYDYIWQDPFSPSKNPELWSARWFSKLAETAKPSATLMTYSVARRVRDALTDGGWRWEKIDAVGSKRNWLKALRKSSIDPNVLLP